LVTFLSEIRQKTNLSTLIFSGYDWHEIQKMPKAGTLVPLIDVLIAGRYISNQRLAQGLIGSRNKTVHFFSNRYSQADLAAVPEAEVILNQNGEIVFSGINPIQWG
jgi:anaerobic ribonucleoside-triphosphate reductase activating protein